MPNREFDKRQVANSQTAKTGCEIVECRWLEKLADARTPVCFSKVGVDFPEYRKKLTDELAC